MSFGFDHSYRRKMAAGCVDCRPVRVSNPRLLYFNHELARNLGLDLQGLNEPALAEVFSGNRLPDDAQPVALAYAGHQFGRFVDELGDGRAVLLGEAFDPGGRRFDVALKGSGRTPFARGGDGRAALAPMLREAVFGEAMHALGVPTTRALAVVATGELVHRRDAAPGAVLTRVASSHLRIGTFQYFAARGHVDGLRRLLRYTVERHYPSLSAIQTPVFELLKANVQRQASLIAQWMNLGFVHGVLNTDNAALSGETLDYGPCAFLDVYDPGTVFSEADREGRYAYGNQPGVARWNLCRLAEALIPLVADPEDRVSVSSAEVAATEVVGGFQAAFDTAMLKIQRRKLGIHEASARDDVSDTTLVRDWLALLQQSRADFSLSWRCLADAADGNDGPLRALISDRAALEAWLLRWRRRIAEDRSVPGDQERGRGMRTASPWIIPRNHRVEEALALATEGELDPFRRLLDAVRHPFEERPGLERYATPGINVGTARFRTNCGT